MDYHVSDKSNLVVSLPSEQQIGIGTVRPWGRDPTGPIANGNVIGSGQMLRQVPFAPTACMDSECVLGLSTRHWNMTARFRRTRLPERQLSCCRGPENSTRGFLVRTVYYLGMVVRDARSAIHAGPWFASLSRLTVDHATVNKPQVVRFDADGAAPSMSREWAPAPGVEGTRARAPKGTSTSIGSPGSTAPELA